MGAWGAPHRAYPAWDRPRVLRTVVDLLASGAVRVDALPVRHFPFEQAVDAYGWLDDNPNEAVKVALTTTTQEESGDEATCSTDLPRGAVAAVGPAAAAATTTAAAARGRPAARR